MLLLSTITKPICEVLLVLMLQVQEPPYLREGVTPTGADYWMKWTMGDKKNSGNFTTTCQAAKTIARYINIIISHPGKKVQ